MLKDSFLPDAHRPAEVLAEVLQAGITVAVARLEAACLAPPPVGVDLAALGEVVPEDE
jgi:hypothetical protein